MAKQWPWRFNLLDISTCSTLAAILAGLLLTRAQFARTVRLAIGWRRDEEEESTHVKNPAWTVRMHNHGPGWCQVTKISYSYALTGHQPSGWKAWDMVLDELDRVDIKLKRDYYLVNIGVGLTIPATNQVSQNIETAAFTESCLRRLSSLDIRLEVESAVGDIYQRTVRCLHTAHKIIDFKKSSAIKNNRLRKHSLFTETCRVSWTCQSASWPCRQLV
jgi:hypothetical protein